MSRLTTLRTPSIGAVSLRDEFWLPRQRKVIETTIPYCLRKCEDTGRIANFLRASSGEKGGFKGRHFNDSDVYKILEGIAYALMLDRNPRLERIADDLVETIAKAQQDDGYLMTYFTLGESGKRWTDMSFHEDYSIGHFIEAAVAYHQATGNRRAIEAATRAADLLVRLFLVEARRWVPGHPEIELALVKLYRLTGTRSYLDLSLRFIESRGKGIGAGEYWDTPEWGKAYSQDDVPVREIRAVRGHAVRAMYLFTGMIHAAIESGDSTLVEPLMHAYEHVTAKAMYVTGGIGASKENEGFTYDYDLPNRTAYCETCAAAGMVFWTHGMNLATGRGEFADLVELELYNGLVAGLGLSGDRFFYANPLESEGDHHRQPWFEVSCCPTQLARVVPSVGAFVYAYDDQRILVNLYVEGEARLSLADGAVGLLCRTGYPWSGDVRITVNAPTEIRFSLYLRMPGWCKEFALQLNGEAVGGIPEDGYLKICRIWSSGDTVSLQLSMPVRIIHAAREVAEDRGKVAIKRGPIVYCFEEVDNSSTYDDVHATNRSTFTLESIQMGDMRATAVRVSSNGKAFLAVPWCMWDNRGSGRMKLWVPFRPDPVLYSD